VSRPTKPIRTLDVLTTTPEDPYYTVLNVWHESGPWAVTNRQGVFEDEDGERVYCDGDARLVPFATEEDAVSAVGTDPHAYVVEGMDGRFYIEPNAEKAAARLLKGRARYGLEEQMIALDLAYSEGADLSAVPVLYQRDV